MIKMCTHVFRVEGKYVFIDLFILIFCTWLHYKTFLESLKPTNINTQTFYELGTCDLIYIYKKKLL